MFIKYLGSLLLYLKFRLLNLFYRNKVWTKGTFNIKYLKKKLNNYLIYIYIICITLNKLKINLVYRVILNSGLWKYGLL